MSTYSTTQLLNRCYKTLERVREKDAKSDLIVPVPQVSFKNKKTLIYNFSDIAKNISRDVQHLKRFVDEELGVRSSIDGSGALLIRGNFKQNRIKSLLKGYLKMFVMCKECDSLNTDLIKENRLEMVNCYSCRSKKPVTQNY